MSLPSVRDVVANRAGSDTRDAQARALPGTDGRFGAQRSTPDASVVDLFSGVGGLSHGFRLEGFDIAAGIDIDEQCRHAFEHNNQAPFLRRDVESLDGSTVAELFVPGRRSVLVGCAPCQPFSVYNQKNSDPRWRLLDEFIRIIAETTPSVVSMENVPRLTHFRNGEVFGNFVKTLEKLDYSVHWQFAFAPDYGVPQRRSRLVLLASRLGEIRLEPPTHEPSQHVTVQQAIGSFPGLDAGDVDDQDPLHRCSRLSALNLKRVRAARAGGSWRDWDDALVAACHKADTGRSYSAVYGRMEWNAPSPTITTQFYGFGNGRFGHPDQDRGISLREGAVLQSFPPDYSFVAPGHAVQFKKLGRMIGNAVPVFLARAIARSIRAHIEEHAR